MSYYEKFQATIYIIQTVVLILTVVGAVWVGLKQAKIYSRQTEIINEQRKISQNMYNLTFSITPLFIYENSEDCLHIQNQGQSGIYFYAFQEESEGLTSIPNPHYIAPGGIHRMYVREYVRKLTTSAPDGNAHVEFQYYLMNTIGSKIKVPVHLHILWAPGQYQGHIHIYQPEQIF